MKTDQRYEEICQKLGFRPEEYVPHLYDTEYDEAPDPFDLLTMEELDYVLKSGYLDVREKKMLICMSLHKETEAEAIYYFNDGAIHETDGSFRINKMDVDASEILEIPEDMELVVDDIKRGMAKVIRQARDNNWKYPVYVTRSR